MSLCIQPLTRHLMNSRKNIRIAFFYNNFYPVKAGATVHGYNLAKELTNIGYEITTFNKIEDGFTAKKQRTLSNIISVFLNSDLIYVRHDLKINHKSYLVSLAKLFKTRSIVELNAPSDELLMNGRALTSVRRLDRYLKPFISLADAVIAVSDSVKQYCEEILDYHNVFVVPNGGEVIDIRRLKVSNNLTDRITSFKKDHDKLVIWSGTKRPWQAFSLVKQIVAASHSNIGFIMVSDDLSVFEELRSYDNVYLFSNLPRDEVKYLIKTCNIGLALYGDYRLSRFGFFNSPLKYYEYLINGLHVVASPKGQMAKDRYDNLFHSEIASDIVKYIDNVNTSKSFRHMKFRSWEDVAKDLDSVIKRVLSNKTYDATCEKLPRRIYSGHSPKF